MKFSRIFLITLMGILLAACTVASATEAPDSADTTSSGMGMGPGSSMMERHHATISEEYAGITNPVPSDEKSWARGEEQYLQLCITCHGAGGMGDGEAGAGLDPQPAPVAHTSQMMGDDYLFWRISEGGVPFRTGMPIFGNLDEQARWDLINYVRALGSGKVAPVRQGAGAGPEASAAQHAEMLAQGVEQEVITQDEAELFEAVHAEMDALLANRPEGMSGNMGEMQTQVLAALVSEGTITQEQADMFADIHERLVEAGLME